MGPFEVMNAYPNRTYQLSGYKDLVNESRLKLHYSVDASASKGLEDGKGMSDVDTNIPSPVDKGCEGTARCDGAHNSCPSDQPLLQMKTEAKSTQRLTKEGDCHIEFW